MWSPRTRGCSRLWLRGPLQPVVVPAHAGVFRSGRSTTRSSASGPRARGGVPSVFLDPAWDRRWSPRTRGCSRATPPIVAEPGVVPAHAGVFRCSGGAPRRPWSGPRARGGVPAIDLLGQLGGVWSPRTRGCSGQGGAHPEHDRVVPAHAGVFRGRWRRCWACSSGPRARGGVPQDRGSSAGGLPWSPRTRGCSGVSHHREKDPCVVPAHAGVFRRQRGPDRADPRGPRARGGVPNRCRSCSGRGAWSPRTRGCSAQVVTDHAAIAVVPAHAGVFLIEPDRHPCLPSAVPGNVRRVVSGEKNRGTVGGQRVSGSPGYSAADVPLRRSVP